MMGLLNSGFCAESTCVPSSSLCLPWLCHHPQPHFSATQNHFHSKLSWPRTVAEGADWIHGKHIFSLNPMFSANCINHFQATREQGNTMTLPVLPVDCEWKEKGKERGKRETGELETNKSGEEWEGKRFKKKKTGTETIQWQKRSRIFIALFTKNEAKNVWFLIATAPVVMGTADYSGVQEKSDF